MGFNLKHIKHYRSWIQNDRKAFKDNCLIAKEYACLCRKLNFAMLLNNSGGISKWSTKKNNYILDYLRKKCPETIVKYRDTLAPENLYRPNTDIKVWSMWWQGEENAPLMFRMCIDSARRHTGQPVTVLSKDNYKQYFDIPDYVLKKHEKGKIAIQHICDIMFCSILASEGGLFTGATVWWSQNATEELLRAPFYSPRAVDLNTWAMSKYRWTGYFMAGNKYFPLFSFARDCLLEYWKNCDKAIEYVFMDYVFELAYEEIPCVREMIDSLPEKNNLRRNELNEHMSDPYDEESFRYYTEGDTFLYKLSWKFGKKEKRTPEGKLTNYGHMLEEAGMSEE